MFGIQPETLHSLIASLHHAALNPEGWHGFVLALERALPGVGASLFGAQAGGREVTYVTTGDGIDPKGLQIFAEYYNHINPFAGFLTGLSDRACAGQHAAVAGAYRRRVLAADRVL